MKLVSIELQARIHRALKLTGFFCPKAAGGVLVQCCSTAAAFGHCFMCPLFIEKVLMALGYSVKHLKYPYFGALLIADFV